MNKAIVLHEKDNVATALADLGSGEQLKLKIPGGTMAEVTLLTAIPLGHKFAVVDIANGAAITKYGETIGQAINLIRTGDHVHVHNLQSLRGRGDLQ